MANVLFIGGTGQISLPCVELAVQKGHKVSVFNRGQRHESLPKGVISIEGDMKDPKSYAQLGQQNFDLQLKLQQTYAAASTPPALPQF